MSAGSARGPATAHTSDMAQLFEDRTYRDWASLPGDLLTAVLRPSAGAHKSVRLVCRHFRDAFDAGVTRATLQLQLMALRGERSLPPVPRCARVARLHASDLEVWGMDMVGAAEVYARLRTWCMHAATDTVHAASATSSTRAAARTWPPLELDLSGKNTFLFRTLDGVDGVQQFADMLRDPAFAPGGLQVLDLNGTRAFAVNSAAVCEALPMAPQLSALRELRLEGVWLRDEEAVGLCRALTAATQLRSLTLLDLSKNNLGLNPLTALASALSDASHLSTLQHLALRDAGLEGTDVLAGAVDGLQLTMLDLNNNNIGDEDAAGWADALARSTRLGSLQHLDFDMNLMTDAGVLKVTAALQAATHITNLRRLVLSSNEGSPARITQLLAAAPHLAASLEVLSLRGADLAKGTVVDELAAPLMAGLQLPRLTCLDLSWCSLTLVGGDGLRRVCAMLRAATQPSGLQELDLSAYDLRSEAECSEVIEALAAATHLSSLRAARLFGDGPLVGPEACARLLRAAPHLCGLTRLMMNCQLLRAAGVAELREALALLPRLRRLCLTGIFGRALREAGLDALVAAVQGAPCLHELQELSLEFSAEGLLNGDDSLDAMVARKAGALVACTRLSGLRSLRLSFGNTNDALCEALGDALVGVHHLTGLRLLHLYMNGHWLQLQRDVYRPSAALHELQRRLLASHLGANATLRFMRQGAMCSR